jgi:hypothetical protein
MAEHLFTPKGLNNGRSKVMKPFQGKTDYLMRSTQGALSDPGL